MRILSVIIFIFSACSNHVDNKRLIGQYVFNDWGRDTLELKSDGTYYHYTFQDGKKLENSGKWKLNSSEDEIKFDDYSFITDKQGTGIWYSRIKLDGNEIHLMYADEENKYYNKID